MRHCVVTQDNATKEWNVEFYENSNHRQIAVTSNYHDIGSWISNWIASAILPY